jgi:hypothetical protein
MALDYSGAFGKKGSIETLAGRGSRSARPIPRHGVSMPAAT